ncbi:MAG: VOC family protein [Vicinamibacterales bacterium]
MHAELHMDAATVMVDGGAEGDTIWGPERQATCVQVADPDAHHARAAAAGVEVMAPLADTPYGARAYTARDPEGFLWTFSTYRPARA